MLLYVMASHQKQLRSLIRNLVEYSRKCQELPVKHEFKLNPTLKPRRIGGRLKWSPCKPSRQLLLPLTGEIY